MTSKLFDLTPKLYWQWVGLNALGFGVATTICLSLQVSESNIEMLFLSGLIVGSLTGICQAIALKKKLPKLRYWQWILANILGGYVGIIVGLIVILRILTLTDIEFSNVYASSLGFSTFGLLVGLGISYAQMIALTRRVNGKSVLVWGGSNVIARAIAWGLTSLLMGQLFSEGIETIGIIHAHISLIGGLLGGGIFGLITGPALGMLQPKLKAH